MFHCRCSNLLALATLFSLGVAFPVSAQVYDASTDFSALNNPNGVWTYGSSFDLMGGLILLPSHGLYYTSNGYADYWGTHANPNLSPAIWRLSNEGGFFVHPGPNSEYVILRWTAPDTQRFIIDSNFSNGNYATTDIHIFKNALSIFEGYVTSNLSSSYINTLPMIAGDTVEFRVGAGGNGYQFDATAAKVRITAIPASGEAVTVGGAIFLQSVDDCSQQSLDFTFRPSIGSAFTRTVLLDSSGSFRIPNILSDNYIVSIKGAKWLRQNIAVDARSGNVSNANAPLLAGDANNDNFADIADLLLLINAYNKVSPDIGYSDAADFTCDGTNDIADLLLLIANYNKQGDS